MIKRLFKDPIDRITNLGIIFVLLDMIVGQVGKELFNSTAISVIGICLMVIHGIGTVILLNEYTKENF